MPELTQADTCRLSSSTSLEVKLEKARMAELEGDNRWLICDTHHPFDFVALGRLDALGFIEMSKPV